MKSVAQNYLENFEDLQKFLESTEAKNLLIFAGSFNPWHQGHSAVLKLCLERLAHMPDPSAEIIVIPDRSPWKSKGQTSFPLDLPELRGLPLTVFLGFQQLEKNPTAGWLPEWRKRLSHGNFHWIWAMGEDNFRAFGQWQSPELVLQALDEIWVAPRAGHAPDQELQNAIKQKNQEMGGEKFVCLPRHAFEHLSSTALRKP